MEKVKIVIITYNISKLIALQCQCLRKFCKDEYEILVVDNSSHLGIAEEIKYYAQQEGCEYIKTSASSINSSSSHSFAANLSYLRIKDFDGIVFYMDHDLFSMKDFSCNEILKDKLIGGVGQQRGDKFYLWPGCVMWHNNKIDHNLIDFSPNSDYGGMDTGGNLYKTVDAVGFDKVEFFNESYDQNPEFTKSFYNFYSKIHNETFYHLINASNWSGSNDHDERINSLINIIKTKAGCE